jgi:hypothetical protein
VDAAPAGQRERVRARLRLDRDRHCEWKPCGQNGSLAVTFTRTAGGTDKHFGGGVVAYRDSAGVGASAKVNATGAPTLSLTTTQADSAVVVANVDWNAVDGTSRTWRSVNGSAATELVYGRSAAHYTAYAGRHANVGAAGIKALGLSAPSGQKYATVAVEVKGSTAAPPTAEFTFSPASSLTGQQVTFNSTGACAATPCTYTWEDDGPDGPGGTQWPLGSVQTLQYTFSDAGVKKVRLTVTDALGRSATVQHDVTVSDVPPLGQPSCQPGAVTATTPAEVRSEIQAGNNVCVTSLVGDVNLDSLTSSTVRHLGTSGTGSIGQVHIAGSSRITIRARMRSVVIRDGSSLITVEQSRIGGESHATRVYDQLIFMPDSTSDVTIQDNDIGWTLADNTGNTGYGCRCYGDHTRLKFLRNKVHDVAADGFQGVGGDDVLIDRNEIGPVGANPDSDEHSDNIQITGNGSNLRITNNWIHHQGYFNGSITGNAGSTYIHGGATGSLIYENNLIEISRGRTEVCGLGTGGTSRSNITLRRNTCRRRPGVQHVPRLRVGLRLRYGQRRRTQHRRRPGRRLRSGGVRSGGDVRRQHLGRAVRGHVRRRRELHERELQSVGRGADRFPQADRRALVGRSRRARRYRPRPGQPRAARPGRRCGRWSRPGSRPRGSPRRARGRRRARDAPSPPRRCRRRAPRRAAARPARSP